MKKQVRQKSQIIDDDSEFRIEELELLAKETSRLPKKQYQIVSIIGSQSSGKSTLLNSLFNTDFEVLNRAQRIGQTTKGIWFSVESSNIIVLDVEGSDSNEREERTKVQRRNSLFAFAISHTLLINIWIQQIGTFKGAQLEILEVILELNLKLFGAEKPKQILYVVRDFVEKKENPQALKNQLLEKIEEAWNRITKPADKLDVKLSDIFKLNVFFLPSRIQPREAANWQKGIGQLRNFLRDSTTDPELTKDNIPIADLPQYMANIWTTIDSDKDVNLPEEKVLLSSMRCGQIKKKVLETYANELRDQIERSERSLNLDFAANIRNIVGKMLADYDLETVGYISQQVDKVKQELEKELSEKIEESFHNQANHIADQCLFDFLDAANKIVSKDKSIEDIKQLKPKTYDSFKGSVLKIAYKEEWAVTRADKFGVELEKKFESQKEKIINDSVKEFDRILKKQMQNVVSNAFYDREVFTQRFWPTLREQLQKVSFKSKNSIQNLYSKLQLGGKKEMRESKIKSLVDKAQQYAEKELRNFIKMKCIDLRYFIMKHFNNEFSNEGDIPRQWPSFKEEDIKALFEDKKKKYTRLVDTFRFVDLDFPENDSSQKGKAQVMQRNSFIDSSSNEFKDELIEFMEQNELRKKLDEEMGKQLEEALRRNKQVYSSSIPTWAFVLLGVAAIDDVLLWLSSPMIALPLTLIIVIVVMAFIFGGKSLTQRLLSGVKNVTSGAIGNATRAAASTMLRKD